MEERRALTEFRTILLAFVEEPTVANFERYRIASRRFDAIRARAKSSAGRRGVNREVASAA